LGEKGDAQSENRGCPLEWPRLGEKGVAQSENLGCPLEWPRLGEKGVALSENLGCLLEWSRATRSRLSENSVKQSAMSASPERKFLAQAKVSRMGF